VGSTLQLQYQITAVNEKKVERKTTTTSKVDKLVVSFDVKQNYKSGPADLYIMVTSPDESNF
jgi:hypothetical protein